MAATSPMNGGMPARMNQSRNELPFRRPMMPPARAKPMQMITKGTAGPAVCSEQRACGPDDGDDRYHDRDEPRHTGDDPDDHLQQEPGGEREHERGDDAHPERRAG